MNPKLRELRNHVKKVHRWQVTDNGMALYMKESDWEYLLGAHFTYEPACQFFRDEVEKHARAINR
jgi:hypothetical protein